MRTTEDHVLEGVVALIEQSLLRPMPGLDDEPRYQMLETVREFGLERLGAAGEEDEVRERHARHFLTLAERRGPRDPALDGPGEHHACGR